MNECECLPQHQSQMSPPGLNHEDSLAARVQKLKHQSGETDRCLLTNPPKLRACREAQRPPACKAPAGDVRSKRFPRIQRLQLCYGTLHYQYVT